jgi:UDP-glucose 4-epimerase
MSILIFGGAGFVGSHVVRKLMDEGEDVVALDVMMPDPPMPPLHDVMDKLRFEFCHGEYASEVNNVVSKYKADRIINLVTSYSPDFEANPPRAVDINLHTQINILEAAKNFGIKRVVQSSSSHVYGAGRPEVVAEDSLAKPDTLYGACKAMNEYLGEHYHKHFGVDHVALRFCLVLGWGRGQRKVVSHRGPWIVELFERPLAGLPVKVPFAASKGSIIYVKDLVAIILTVLRAQQLPHRVYDVVTDPRSKAQAAAIVKELLPAAQIEIDMHGAFGEERPPERMTQRAWQNPRLTQDFGYKDKYSFKEAIADYFRMAQANKFTW